MKRPSNFKEFLQLIVAPATVVIAVAGAMQDIGRLQLSVLAGACLVVSTSWAVYVWTAKMTSAFDEQSKFFRFSGPVRWSSLLGPVASVGVILTTAFGHTSIPSITLDFRNATESAITLRPTGHFLVLAPQKPASANAELSGVFRLRSASYSQGEAEKLPVSPNSTGEFEAILPGVDEVVMHMRTGASEIQLILFDENQSVYVADNLHFTYDSILRTSSSPLVFEAQMPALELQYLHLGVRFGGPSAGGGTNVVYRLIDRDSPTADEPPGTISDRDDIKLVGTFNRDTHWRLLWIFPDGDVEMGAGSDRRSATVSFPPDEESVSISLPDSGVHVILLVAADDERYLNGASLVSQVRRAGKPPATIPGPWGGAIRSFRREIVNPDEVLTLPNEYARRLRDSIPSEIANVFVAFLSVQGK